MPSREVLEFANATLERYNLCEKCEQLQLHPAIVLVRRFLYNKRFFCKVASDATRQNSYGQDSYQRSTGT